MAQGIDRKVELYQDIEISTLTLPGRPVKPAYAFVGDYLVLAKSDALIRQCIDAKTTEQGLATAPRYRVVAEKVPSQHSAALFIDIQGLLVAMATGGRALPEGRPPRPEVLVAQQLRGVRATMAAEKDGVILEAYSRPGLVGLLGAVVAFARQAQAQQPVTVPDAPKPADF
jgi:hypothetical protein